MHGFRSVRGLKVLRDFHFKKSVFHLVKTLIQESNCIPKDSLKLRARTIGKKGRGKSKKSKKGNSDRERNTSKEKMER